MARMKHCSVRLPHELYAWLLVGAQDGACTMGAMIRQHLTRQRQADREAQALATRKPAVTTKGA
jgi:hypothetical protein